MTGHALVRLFKCLPASCDVADRDGSRVEIAHVSNECNDTDQLGFAKLEGLHRCTWNTSQNRAPQVIVGRNPLESTGTEINVGHDIPVFAVTSRTLVCVDSRSVLNVGRSVAGLRRLGSQDRSYKE